MDESTKTRVRGRDMDRDLEMVTWSNESPKFKAPK